ATTGTAGSRVSTRGAGVSQRHRSAVILGASMSGLLAARALSGHVARVTLVERDALPERDESRKGVPQSNHAHGLLASGYQAMDEYFPGMMDELEAGPADRLGPVDRVQTERPEKLEHRVAGSEAAAWTTKTLRRFEMLPAAIAIR